MKIENRKGAGRMNRHITEKDFNIYAICYKVTVKKPSIKKAVSNSKQNVKVVVNKVPGAKGYKLLYTTDKKFKKGIKTVSIGKTSVTLAKLKNGKTYYVKVCAYEKDSKRDNVYGPYSKVKQVKTRNK